MHYIPNRAPRAWVAILLLIGGLVLSTGLSHAQSPAPPAPRYSFIDIGVLTGPNGPSSTVLATAVNNEGRVVGQATYPINWMFTDRHAVEWRRGQLRDLHAAQQAGGPHSYAGDVNDAGQVLGWVGYGYQHSTLLWNPDGTTAVLPGIDGQGINEAGAVSGFTAGGGFGHAALGRDGAVHDLTPGLYGHSSARGINQAGMVVGYATRYEQTPAVTHHAALWSAPGVWQWLAPYAGGRESYAHALNDLGEVAGYSRDTSGVSEALQAVLWRGGQPTSLGGLSAVPFSSATAINNTTQIVGHSAVARTPWAVQYHAFVWEDGVMQDLNLLIPPAAAAGYELGGASDINDKGCIVGSAYLRGTNTQRGFLLVPTALASVRVEPAVVGGGGSGTGTVVLDRPAPFDVVVSLTDNLPAATVPPTVVVAGGDTTAQFTVQTSPVTAPQAGTITASFGMVTQTTSFVVQPFVNRPPTAAAGPDQVVECAGERTRVLLEGSATDPDGDPLDFVWRQGAQVLGHTATLEVSLTHDRHTLTLTVTDPHGASDSDDVVVDIVDRTPPVLAIPPDIDTGNEPGECGASVNPGAATAVDVCEGPIAAGGSRSDGKALDARYPVGTTTITWTATDASGNAATATQSVSVRDVEAPRLTDVSADPAELGPPNRQMVDVTVSYTARDNCDPRPATSLSVTSSEPVTGQGDSTAPDWEVVDAHHVRLRAERSARGDGRIYTITITSTDAAGNVATATATVTVPRSRKRE